MLLNVDIHGSEKIYGPSGNSPHAAEYHNLFAGLLFGKRVLELDAHAQPFLHAMLQLVGSVPLKQTLHLLHVQSSSPLNIPKAAHLTLLLC